jgi:hypothetical protein
MKARLNTLMGQAQQELNSFGDAAQFGDMNQVKKENELMFATLLRKKLITFIHFSPFTSNSKAPSSSAS